MMDSSGVSSYYGSNSGNVHTQCEDLAKFLQNHTYLASRYNQDIRHRDTKEKVRTVVDSIAAESDARNIHIAYPAAVVDNESREQRRHVDSIEDD